MLPISANSRNALQRNIQQLIEYCQQHPETALTDMAFTLQVGRETLSYRASIVADDLKQFVANAALIDVNKISARRSVPAVGVMFSGQGSQYPAMGLDLHSQDADFQQAFEAVLEAFSPYLHFDLRQLIYPTPVSSDSGLQLLQTEVAQPALFAIEYALAMSYLAKGLQPAALIGHSIGEYVAATLARVLTLQDAARLIAVRGQLMQQLPAGKMIAVQACADNLQTFLPDCVDIALENSPINTVISGSVHAMQWVENALQDRQIPYQALQTSHAFHSRMLDPILDTFRQHVTMTTRKPPCIAMISNVTGTWLTNEEACSVEYWVKQLRNCVKFSQGIATIERQLSPFFIEVGPGRTLQSLVNQQGIHQVTHSLPTVYDTQSARGQQLKVLGLLWEQGIALQPVNVGRRIPLPTYSWDLQRYWIEPSANVQHNEDAIKQASRATINGASSEFAEKRRPSYQELSDWLRIAWKKALGTEPRLGDDHFFNQGGHSLSAVHFIDLLPEIIRSHVQVVHLYQYPTFSQLLRFIEQSSQHAPCIENCSEAELFIDGREL